jgi:hypothetical protein
MRLGARWGPSSPALQSLRSVSTGSSRLPAWTYTIFAVAETGRFSVVSSITSPMPALPPPSGGGNRFTPLCVPQGFVHLSCHPQSMEQDAQLPGYSYQRALLRVPLSMCGHAQPPSPQV